MRSGLGIVRDGAGLDGESLASFVEILSETLRSDQFFKALAALLRRSFGVDRVSLTIYDDEQDQFNCVAVALDDTTKIGRGAFLPRTGSRVGKAFDEGRTLAIVNLRDGHDYLEDELLAREGMSSGLTLPLLVSGKSYGTLNLNWRNRTTLQAPDLAALDGIAVSLASAIIKYDWRVPSAIAVEDDTFCFHAEALVLRRPSMRGAIDRLRRYAGTNAAIFLSGETGTGKGMLAKALHAWSRRNGNSFIKCDCSSLSASLIESELFGHERGAFTGAVARRAGRIELAHGGTLFLDELGEIPLEVQPKLLGVLDDKEFMRVGGTSLVQSDFRVISATHRDLLADIESKAFRRDLFHRLCVLDYRLPSLRDVPLDVIVLSQHFAQAAAISSGLPVKALHRSSLDVLTAYDWPGNVRELANVIERAFVLSDGEELIVEPEMFGATEATAEADQKLSSLEAVERQHIENVLEHTGGRISGEGSAAEILGLHPNTLRSKMARLNITKTKNTPHE